VTDVPACGPSRISTLAPPSGLKPLSYTIPARAVPVGDGSRAVGEVGIVLLPPHAHVKRARLRHEAWRVVMVSSVRISLHRGKRHGPESLTEVQFFCETGDRPGDGHPR